MNEITWQEDPPNSGTFVAYVNEIGVGLASKTLYSLDNKWLAYYLTDTTIKPILNSDKRPKLFDGLSEAKQEVETWINQN